MERFHHIPVFIYLFISRGDGWQLPDILNYDTHLNYWRCLLQTGRTKLSVNKEDKSGNKEETRFLGLLV